MEKPRYAGFWIRVLAALIDTVLLLLVLAPLLTLIYGGDYWLSDSLVKGPVDLLLNYILPAVVIVLFWVYRSATPGKMILRLKIVDATSGHKPTTKQLIGRYLGYYLAVPTLLLSLIWVGWDKRKQGLHDKLAGTLVVREQAGQASSTAEADAGSM